MDGASVIFRLSQEIATMTATLAAEGFPRRAFTVEDIGRMIDAGVLGEDEKFELIEGEIVMMAAKEVIHERVKSALLVAIARALPDDLTLGAEITLRLTDTDSGCHVEMAEVPVGGPLNLIPRRLALAAAYPRNRECLARLAAIAERRAKPK